MRKITAEDRGRLRRFGLEASAFLVVVIYVVRPWIIGRPAALTPLIFISGLALCAQIWPAALRIPYAALLRIGLSVGAIQSRLLLLLVFLSIIVPFHYVFRRRWQRAIPLKFEPDVTSYLVNSRSQVFDMTKPY